MKMKTPILTTVLLTAAAPFAFAGGNTSVVHLDKVTSIKIEDEKITIVGSGMIRRRIRTDAEHGDSKVFGQPALWFHAKAIDCEFEIIPYHLRSDVKGVPGPDPDKITPEERAMSMKWWAGTLAQAKQIQVGDAVGIGYQREKTTITSVYVTHVVGSGSLTVEKRGEKRGG